MLIKYRLVTQCGTITKLKKKTFNIHINNYLLNGSQKKIKMNNQEHSTHFLCVNGIEGDIEYRTFHCELEDSGGSTVNICVNGLRHQIPASPKRPLLSP